MISTSHDFRLVSRFLLLVTAAVLITVSALPAFAQSTGTGTIAGRVYNPATREYVENAEISIPGTNKVMVTSSDGTYTLINVPAGTTTVTVDYTGYKTQTTVVNVVAGQQAKADFDLISTELQTGTSTSGDQPLKMSAFTVSGTREGNAKAIMQQKESMTVSSVVASETFGNIAEGNIGEFIKYLPAIQMDTVEADARSPRIRGLPAGLTSVTMNGMKLASADGFIQNNGTDTSGGAGKADRSFGFEQVSLSSIDEVQVNYTTDASFDADAPGGNINLIPKHAYQLGRQQITFTASAMTNLDDMTLAKTTGPDDTPNSKILPNASLEYGNSFFNHRLGVIVSLNESNSINEQSQFAPGYDTTPTATDPRPLVLNSLKFKDGQKETERSSAGFTIDFKATDNLSFSLIGSLNHYDAFIGNRTFAITTTRANVPGDGLNTPWANVPITATTSTMAYLNKRTQTYSYLPSFEYKTDNLKIDGVASMSQSVNNYAGGESKSWPGNTVGGTTISTTGMTASAAHAADNDYAWNIQQTGGLDWGNLANYKAVGTATPTFGEDGRYAKNLVYQGKLDIKYTTNWHMPTWFQFGPKVTETTWIYQNPTAWQTWNYVNGPGSGAGGNWASFPSSFIFSPGYGATINSIGGLPVAVQNHNAIGYLFSSNPQDFVQQNSAANYNTAFVINPHYVKEEIDALYGMIDIKPIRKLDIRAGVRFERTREEVKSFVPLTTAQVQAAGFSVTTAGVATTIPGIQYEYFTNPRGAHTQSYGKLFPSASGKYYITPNLLALCGYSFTVTRPSYSDISGNVSEDDTATPTPTLSLPNPFLKPSYANNFSASLYYYIQPVGSLGFTLFQNNIKNFEESETLTGDPTLIAEAAQFGYTDPKFAGYSITSTQNLPGTVTYRGASLDYNQNLSFLPPPLSGFSIFANYTRLYTTVTGLPNPAVDLNTAAPYNFAWITGIAPNIINYGVSWRYKRLSLRINARWTDRMSISNTVDSWRQQNTKVDFTANYRLTSHLSLFCYSRNIFDVPDHDYTYFYNNSFHSTAMLQSTAGQGIEHYGAYLYAGVTGNF